MQAGNFLSKIGVNLRPKASPPAANKSVLIWEICGSQKCQSNAQGGVKNCKKIQKIAEKTRRFAEFCKKLQKKCASLHNFCPSAALLIEIPGPPSN